MAEYKASTFWILCCCLGLIPGIIYYALAEKSKGVVVIQQPPQQQVIIMQQPTVQPKAESKPEMFCQECGHAIDKKLTFCPNCGTKL